MVDLLQLAFSGLALGAVYGLLAVGFVAVFTVRGVINLAQGEFASLAGLVAIGATGAGLPLPAALPLAVLVVVAVAVGMERLAVAPVRRLTTLTSIVLTLGVSTALKAAMLLIWGPDGHALARFPGADLNLGGVSVRGQELWLLGGCAAVGAATWYFYQRTRPGKALRACAQDPVAAQLVGISPRRASLLSFALAGVVGAVAGLLASPLYLSSWNGGLTLGLKGFVAATLGGLVSIRGALAGGLLLGVLEALVAGYLNAGLRDAAAFVVLLVVLIARPGGVFGRRPEARV